MTGQQSLISIGGKSDDNDVTLIPPDDVSSTDNYTVAVVVDRRQLRRDVISRIVLR